MKVVRFERAVKLDERVQRFMAERGISSPTRQPPLNFLLPLIDHATLEEDDDLQTCWARLLVNAGDAATNIELRTVYVSILSNLNSFDIKCLSKLVESYTSPSARGVIRRLTAQLPERVLYHLDQSEIDRPAKEVSISMANLARNALVNDINNLNGTFRYSMLTVTDLGFAFAAACCPALSGPIYFD